MHRTHRTPKKRGPAKDWPALFLKAIRETGNVWAACRAAGVGRQTAYSKRDRDAGFAEEWDEAAEEATDLLEMEARDRARAGVDDRMSATLLIFLLKANRPEKYRDNPDVKALVDQLTRANAALAAAAPEKGRGGGGEPRPGR